MSSNRHERRQHRRHSVHYAIEVSPHEKIREVKTECLHNISDGGISFTTDNGERYRIGQSLAITIAASEKASSLAASATVMWMITIHFDSTQLSWVSGLIR